MTATNQNFEIWAGDEKTIRFDVTDESTGSAMSMAGMYPQFGLFKDERARTQILLIAGSVSGCTIMFDLAGSLTGSLAGVYYHETQVTDAASHSATIATGLAKINRDAI